MIKLRWALQYGWYSEVRFLHITPKLQYSITPSLRLCTTGTAFYCDMAQRWLKLIQRVPLIKKAELLDDILQETEELIKIFVSSIKTAEKKQK